MNDRDYLSTIIQSLPGYLGGYANAQLNHYHMAAQGAALAHGVPLSPQQIAAAMQIDPKILIHIVEQKADC